MYNSFNLNTIFPLNNFVQIEHLVDIQHPTLEQWCTFNVTLTALLKLLKMLCDVQVE